MTTTSTSPNARVRADGAAPRLARVREIARFLLAGASTTLVSYALYLVLLHWLAYPVAYAIAYVAGIAWSYLASSLFVFRRRLSFARAATFPLVYLAQYAAGTLLLVGLVEGLGVSRTFAPIAVIVLTLPLTYVISRRVIAGNASDAQSERTP